MEEWRASVRVSVSAGSRATQTPIAYFEVTPANGTVTRTRLDAGDNRVVKISGADAFGAEYKLERIRTAPEAIEHPEEPVIVKLRLIRVEVASETPPNL